DRYKYLDVFRVDLPVERWRGFPPSWKFVVLRGGVRASNHTDPKEIESQFIAFRDDYPKGLRIPVVFVSDDPGVHLKDIFPNLNGPIICLDVTDLQQCEATSKPFLGSPLVKGLRGTVDLRRPEALKEFCPYAGVGPVSGWQFFGRRKELHDI